MTQYNHNYITDMTSKIGCNFRGVFFGGIFSTFWGSHACQSVKWPHLSDCIRGIHSSEGIVGSCGDLRTVWGCVWRGWKWGRMVWSHQNVLRRGVFGGSYLWLCGSNHSDSFIFRKSEIRRPILGFGKKQLRRKRPFFAIFERGSIFFHWKKGQSTY